MKLSGVVHFDDLTAGAINLLCQFQRTHPEIEINFSSDQAHATANWQSFESLSRLTRVAASVEIQRTVGVNERDAID